MRQPPSSAATPLALIGVSAGPNVRIRSGGPGATLPQLSTIPITSPTTTPRLVPIAVLPCALSESHRGLSSRCPRPCGGPLTQRACMTNHPGSFCTSSTRSTRDPGDAGGGRDPSRADLDPAAEAGGTRAGVPSWQDKGAKGFLAA